MAAQHMKGLSANDSMREIGQFYDINSASIKYKVNGAEVEKSF